MNSISILLLVVQMCMLQCILAVNQIIYVVENEKHTTQSNLK